MGRVWTDVHQVGDALAALALGIAFEQLTYLEEQHHEDGLGKLGLSTGQEADAEGSDGSHRHEEVLVERFSVGNAFSGLFQRLMAY